MIQHRAACFILDKPWRSNVRDSVTQIISELSWSTLQYHRKYAQLTLLFQLLHQSLNIVQINIYHPHHCTCAHPLEIINLTWRAIPSPQLYV